MLASPHSCGQTDSGLDYFLWYFLRDVSMLCKGIFMDMFITFLSESLSPGLKRWSQIGAVFHNTTLLHMATRLSLEDDWFQ